MNRAAVKLFAACIGSDIAKAGRFIAKLPFHIRGLVRSLLQR